MKRFKTRGVLLVFIIFLSVMVGNCDDSPGEGTGGNHGDGQGTEPGTPSLSLKYNGASISGNELETAIVTNTLTFTAVNEKGEDIDFTLRSSKTTVARVSGKTVTLVAVGETDITATAKGDSTRTQTIKLTVKPDTQYTIVVTGGTADKEQAAAGDIVTLIPGKEDGKAFVNWTLNPVVSMSTGNKFTMPASNVVATANFEDWSPAGKEPRYITTNYGQDASTELLVQWHNDVQFDEQDFQIVKAGTGFAGAETTKVTGTEFMATDTAPLLVGDFARRSVFRKKVTGLEPDTLYEYRMGGEGRWSEVFEHRTASVAFTDFSFTVVADSQDETKGQSNMRATLRAADNYDTDNRFFLHCGDVVEQIGLNPNEIVYYTEAANDFNVKKPVITTQGNHDTYNTSLRTDGTPSYQDQKGEATIFNHFMTFPDNGSAIEPNPDRSQSYYFYYNKVLFVMLNTMVANDRHSLQANWLRQVLDADRAANKSLYTIVVMHKGPFGNHYYESSDIPTVRGAYGKIFSDYSVDIVFHGHDHTYTRSHPIKIGTNTGINDIDFTPVTNGTIYSIPGSTGAKRYGESEGAPATNPLWANGYVKRTRVIGDITGGVFVNVKVTADKLIVIARRTDGTINDYFPDTYEVPKKTY